MKAVLLHLQAKHEVGHILHSVHEADSQVSRAAASLPQIGRTVMSKQFIRARKHSWQAHLERISPFLVHKGEWWTETADAYEFMDGESDPECHLGGPELLHFSTTTLGAVVQRQRACWKQIADAQVPLPAQDISLYTDEGLFTETMSLQQQIDEDSSLEDCQQDTEETLLPEAIEPEMQLEPPSAIEFQTKLCKAIHKAIGENDELMKLDDVRATIKSYTHTKQTPPKDLIKQHKSLKEKIFLLVKTHADGLKQQILAYDFSTDSTVNMDTPYNGFSKNLKYTKWLLSVWETL